MIKEVSKMKEYDKLLGEVRTKILQLNQTIRTTAKEYKFDKNKTLKEILSNDDTVKL
jgi:hypothetical protein